MRARWLVMLVLLPLPLAAQADRGGFVVTMGGTEIAREGYAFDGSVLTSTLFVPSRRLIIDGTTTYDAALTPIRYVSSGRFVSDTAAFQTIAVTFGDSALWAVTGANPQRGSTPLTRPYSVLRNLAFSHLAVVLRRYDVARGGRQELQLWMPEGPLTVPCAMELTGETGRVWIMGIEMPVVRTRDGWLRRVEVPAQGVTVEWRDGVDVGIQDTTPLPAEPAAPETVSEWPFAFATGMLRLEGTLTLPRTVAGKPPVVLIVAGSGPTDRNGNSGLGLRTDMYAQLAWRLAERGIASLRYDKRGLGATRGTFDPSQTTFDDFVADVVAGAKALAADGRFAKVVLAGHSEGAGLAVRAANEKAPVAGIALLAGLGRPFVTVLREQLARQLDSATMGQFDVLMPRYLRGDSIGDPPSGLAAFLAPVNRRFIQTEVAYDAPAEVARVRVPVLILQGATDIQISVADAQALAHARPSADLVVIPEANHLFKHAPVATLAAQAAVYTDPSLSIVPALVESLVRWIGKLP